MAKILSVADRLPQSGFPQRGAGLAPDQEGCPCEAADRRQRGGRPDRRGDIAEQNATPHAAKVRVEHRLRNGEHQRRDSVRPESDARYAEHIVLDRARRRRRKAQQGNNPPSLLVNRVRDDAHRWVAIDPALHVICDEIARDQESKYASERRSDQDQRNDRQSVETADTECEQGARKEDKGGGGEEKRHHQSRKRGQSTKVAQPFDQDIRHLASIGQEGRPSQSSTVPTGWLTQTSPICLPTGSGQEQCPTWT